MKLDKRSVNELQALMKKEFGKDISFSEAEEQGSKLVLLFKTLIQNDVQN